MRDKNKVTESLLWENLQNCINRVEKGETFEGRDVLHSIAEVLSSEKISSITGKPLEIPNYVRDYLSRCLLRIVAGENANHALGLTKPGRPSKIGYRQKRLVAHLVYELHDEQGVPVREACESAVEMINEIAKNIDQYPAWKKIISETTGDNEKKALEEQIQRWYYDHKEELQQIYEKAEL
ncbi:MAG: hypothetical protein P4M14_11170 [Gammaproteobacteria bacterium]|nr:hypothetical protein [Gammaproteobacteria bacterium]